VPGFCQSGLFAPSAPCRFELGSGKPVCSVSMARVGGNEPCRPPPAARTGGDLDRQPERRPRSRAHGWRSHPYQALCAAARRSPGADCPPSRAGSRPRRHRSGDRLAPSGSHGRAALQGPLAAAGLRATPGFRPPAPAGDPESRTRRPLTEPTSAYRDLTCLLGAVPAVCLAAPSISRRRPQSPSVARGEYRCCRWHERASCRRPPRSCGPQLGRRH
jgi:hypothetical protein